MPAIGVVVVDAIHLNSFGNFVTLSPWLIHTSSNPCPSSLTLSSISASNFEWPRAHKIAWPYSIITVRETSPPAVRAMSCIPKHMPNTGQPSSNKAEYLFTWCSSTDSGPPDKITPLGLISFRKLRSPLQEIISQKIFISLILRAINCVY